jgi:outer membrane protein assembly factor BamD (BamD/ComL family)
MAAARINVLKERLADLETAIAGFERRRAELIVRRRGAVDHVMVEIDERLKVNERTTEALKRTLELVQADLRRTEAHPERE